MIFLELCQDQSEVSAYAPAPLTRRLIITQNTNGGRGAGRPTSPPPPYSDFALFIKVMADPMPKQLKVYQRCPPRFLYLPSPLVKGNWTEYSSELTISESSYS